MNPPWYRFFFHLPPYFPILKPLLTDDFPMKTSSGYWISHEGPSCLNRKLRKVRVLTVARRRVKRRRPWLRRRPPSALMGIFQGEFLGGLWWFTIRGFIRWLSNGKYPVMVTYPVMVYGLNHQISMGFMVISNFRWLQAIEDMFNRQIWGYSQEI